jgi:Transposase DDE domain
MRCDHCTISPVVVRSTARFALQTVLPWKAYGRKVSVARLLDLLLLVAALCSSLSAVTRRFRFGFSHETARQAVYAQLPDTSHLTAALVDGLDRFTQRLRKRRRHWVVAIDVHYSPFYGDSKTPGVVGGPKKQGAHYFFAYATAVLVHRRHRYTVGLLPHDGTRKPHELVAALLEQVQTRGWRLRGVVLDSAFGSGETLLLLQTQGLAYAVPLQRQGKGSNRRNDCFALPVGTVTTVDWVTEKSRQAVQTQAVVVQRPKDPHVRVYAFGGWDASQARLANRAAELAKAWYRRRFGIETSYRQMRETKGQTTAASVEWRLLLVGLGLLLRQVWVWLTTQIAKARKLPSKAWVEELPLQRLREWLAEILKGKYPEEREIALPVPLLEIQGL